ncbi:MAG TPA: N-acetylmuramoyl-L-alanine amidase-like domain-containing protein [Gammaproteobacteria bacterium]|nr:N-acetylmuramoyl-L-alanine amidase-like domain-containing protein [Gammaproteobacteria bacterium]
MKKFVKLLIYSFVLLLMPMGFAASNAEQPTVIPAYEQSQYDQEIQQLFQSISTKKTSDIKAKLAAYSAYFLGKPYLFDAAGEGENSRYNQNPLYRTDAFDCVTYVNTIVSLAESNNLAQFQRNIKNINYRNGKPAFINRNHFMETDWNLNNAHKGYVRDITASFVDNQGKPISVSQEIRIDKPNWFLSMNVSQLKLLQPLSPSAIQQRLRELQSFSRYFSPQNSQLVYLPMTRLFDAQQQPVDSIFNQIPSGSIIEIVNPRAKLENQIGTPLYISHIGLAIRTPNGLMFREASSYLHRVADVPLAHYLLVYLHMNNYTGINIQEVLKV